MNIRASFISSRRAKETSRDIDQDVEEEHYKWRIRDLERRIRDIRRRTAVIRNLRGRE